MTTTRLRSRFVAWMAIARNLFYRAIGRTDVSRWTHYNFPAEWKARSSQIAKLIPEGSTVWEFGCGTGELGQMLPPRCTYIPTDLVARHPGVRIIDLNSAPLPIIPRTDSRVAVLAGVLEYVHDVPRVARWMSKNFEHCICSYVGVEDESRSTVQSLKHRLGMGWKNHYPEADLLAAFSECGWNLQNSEQLGEDRDERIYVFESLEPEKLVN
jgi:hypothetical protein